MNYPTLIALSLASSLVSVVASTAHADTLLGLYADANYWHTSNDTKFFTADADHKSRGQVMVSASLEHGVPFVPNARVRHASLKADGTYTALPSELKLSNTDAIAYYEVLDNVVSVDVGVGVKVLSGDWRVGTATGTEINTASLDKTLPMAYASVGARLPFTGLSAKAELGIARSSQVSATDAQAEVKYNLIDNLAVDVGAKVGYRILDVRYDEVNNSKLETSFRGPYVGLEVHF